MNQHYPLRSVLSGWDTNGVELDKTLTCRFCFREFGLLEDGEEMTLRFGGCHASDCPSHWESQGLPNPSHTTALYAESDEPAFIKFWSPLGGEWHFGDSQAEFFEQHIPDWNKISGSLTQVRQTVS